jgi:hypothetical protein
MCWSAMCPDHLSCRNLDKRILSPLTVSCHIQSHTLWVSFRLTHLWDSMIVSFETQTLCDSVCFPLANWTVLCREHVEAMLPRYVFLFIINYQMWFDITWNLYLDGYIKFWVNVITKTNIVLISWCKKVLGSNSNRN